MVEPLSAGARLHHNRYTITRVIAAGGMGVVYLAFDETREETVAVKQTFFTDAGLRKAFEREAKLLERLNHPAIPKVTDRFEVGELSFLVMSFVTGKDLGQMLNEKLSADRNPFPVEKVLQWADSLLQTLDFLHSQNPPIIHRDIKPANLKEARDGRLMLLDFGLAKGHATKHSQPASLAANSPGFSSPEQTQNEGTDARSDIYSVAATMYQLLTGIIPPGALMRGVSLVKNQPDPLQPVLQIAPDIPGNIAGVIMAGLSFLPSGRPQSAREMRRLLGLAPSGDSYIGQVIQGCRIEKKLGEGAMGAVYQGTHEFLGVERAIKVILPEPPPDENSVNRFLIEAKAAAMVNHDNVMRVFDFGKAKDNAFVMVMEMIRGENLESLLKREGPFPPKGALDIAFQIGKGLFAAHEKGIVHRDLKPQNVMVVENGQVKVVDFGIAKILSSQQNLTGEGFIIGTQLYMSPEQLTATHIDTRSDQYTLALLVFEMIAGRLPFNGDTPNAMILARLVEGPIPLRQLVPGVVVTDRFEQVLARALALDPNDRFPTISDFVETLKEALVEKAEPTLEVTGSQVGGSGIFVVGSARSKEETPVEEFGPKMEASAPPKEALVEKLKPIIENVGYQVGDSRIVGAGIEVVYIPPGKFRMGSPKSEEGREDREFQHRVVITEPFWMGKYAVTQAQWEAVMGTNPSHFEDCPQCPVENVSWDDCQEFIKRLNAKNDGNTYALPTEAQWEYACRAGTTTPFSFGATVTPSQVNYCGDYPYGNTAKGKSRGETVLVGSLKSPNAWGLHEMHGNVEEWCADWYDENYYKNSPTNDPKGPEYGVRRVQRGGYWNTNAVRCRAASRSSQEPGKGGADGGFRVVVVPTLEKVKPVEVVPTAVVFPVVRKAGDVMIGAAGIELVHIPAGEFLMGSPESEEGRNDNEFQHRVVLTEPFWMGKYAVTQAQWELVMGKRLDKSGWGFPGPNNPAESVRWYDCQDFIERLNAKNDGNVYALPTEAQWEYACRAGTKTPFSFGATITPKQVNYNGNFPYGNAFIRLFRKGVFREKTVPVGSLNRPNAWGLHDMHGNIWEWCADWLEEKYYKTSPVHDPKGPDEPGYGRGRVLRGGSWDSSALDCRSACRGYDGRSFCHGSGSRIGFRVVVLSTRAK